MASLAPPARLPVVAQQSLDGVARPSHQHRSGPSGQRRKGKELRAAAETAAANAHAQPSRVKPSAQAIRTIHMMTLLRDQLTTHAFKETCMPATKPL